MDWLVRNPLAGLTGPQFLLLYGAVILLAVMVRVLRISRRGHTDYYQEMFATAASASGSVGGSGCGSSGGSGDGDCGGCGGGGGD